MQFYCSEQMQNRELNTCKQDIYSFLHFLLPTNTEPNWTAVRYDYSNSYNLFKSWKSVLLSKLFEICFFNPAFSNFPLLPMTVPDAAGRSNTSELGIATWLSNTTPFCLTEVDRTVHPESTLYSLLACRIVAADFEAATEAPELFLVIV